MTNEEKAELLDWIADQDRLRIEAWHHCGGRQSVMVWTICDDDDSPSGNAESAMEALTMAMNYDLDQGGE